MEINPGTDTFPLNLSGLVARIETFEKQTETNINFGPFSAGTETYFPHISLGQRMRPHGPHRQFLPVADLNSFSHRPHGDGFFFYALCNQLDLNFHHFRFLQSKLNTYI